MTSAAEDETDPATQPAEAPADGAELESLKDRASYAIGVSIGRNISQQDLDLNPDIVAQAIAETLAGTEPKLTTQQMQQTMMELQASMQAKAAAEAEANKVQGAKFLESNKDAEGVKVTDTGLQYKIIEEGDGPKPTATDTVKVHYAGALIDGTEFDSSYKRGEPAQFRVNGVIPGWTQALQMMRKGAKWRLFLPPDLAYGARGAGPDIGPHSVLVFDVELLDIVKQPEADDASDGG
ncbi:MAG: FKBP-type peptidyl-prolyl cis-trans isomerase [Phycisphaeraceae bacterium]|nr:FKBP-type peptidyl-prolyl cis-trans isomerase [Phycisphaeraceae bacterium]